MPSTAKKQLILSKLKRVQSDVTHGLGTNLKEEKSRKLRNKNYSTSTAVG